MKPIAGAVGAPPPRKQSTDVAESPPPALAPTSFFMASESELDVRDAEHHQETTDSTISDSTYGVRSMEESVIESRDELAEEPGNTHPMRPHRRQTALRIGRRRTDQDEQQTVDEQPWAMRRDMSMDSLHRELSASSSESSPHKDTSQQRSGSVEPAFSQPLTPVSFASPMLGSSVPSSPKSFSGRSFRHSDDDEYDSRSQAIASSDDEAEPSSLSHQQMASHQFIMPSITMPSRRPFTARGRTMGRLKVLVAGACGTGKTSLIKSIVQTCEDIVHVDTLPASTPTVSAARSTNKHRTTRISEIHASTKAYPQWWAEPEVTGVRRRGSTGDNILERNLCFVDTPGYDRGTSMLENMEPTLRYIESQFKLSTSSSAMTDSELLGLLGGSGGYHVDVVLYLINHDLKPADIEFIRQLHTLTNVIPLLAKADTLDADTATELKQATLATLSAASITPTDLPTSGPSPPSLPFAVCSLPSHELEAMDASVLMKSEHIQPLHPSDLSHLLTTLLDPTTIPYLKHTSARKLLAWRASHGARAPGLPHPALTSLVTASSLLHQTHRSTTSTSTLVPLPTSTTLTRAGAALSEHQAREERLAQLRLASWAGSLRRSLANERRRYEALAQSERREWLRTQLHDIGRLDVDAAASVTEKGGELVRVDGAARARPLLSRAALEAADPLGLARWGQRGWLVLQAGGVGVLGALAAWTIGRWLAEGLAQAWAAEDGGWFGLFRREITEVMVCE